MKELPAGRFKQSCLRVLDEVRETREGVIITKRGKPVAQLLPLPVAAKGDWAGAMRGTGRITGDLVAPAVDVGEWESLRD